MRIEEVFEWVETELKCRERSDLYGRAYGGWQGGPSERRNPRAAREVTATEGPRPPKAKVAVDQKGASRTSSPARSDGSQQSTPRRDNRRWEPRGRTPSPSRGRSSNAQTPTSSRTGDERSGKGTGKGQGKGQGGSSPPSPRALGKGSEGPHPGFQTQGRRNSAEGSRPRTCFVCGSPDHLCQRCPFVNWQAVQGSSKQPAQPQPTN